MKLINTFFQFSPVPPTTRGHRLPWTVHHDSQQQRQWFNREAKPHHSVSNYSQFSISKYGRSFLEEWLFWGCSLFEKGKVSLKVTLNKEGVVKPYTALLGVSICPVAIVLNDSESTQRYKDEKSTGKVSSFIKTFCSWFKSNRARSF